MSGIEILESLKKHNNILDNISSRLDSLRTMFDGRVKVREDGFAFTGEVEAKTIYQSPDCTIVLGIWGESGAVWPIHSHAGSLEYLLVIKGRFSIDISGEKKILEKSDYCIIHPGVKHTTISLEPDSRMVGICIPPEKAYELENDKWQKIVRSLDRS